MDTRASIFTDQILRTVSARAVVRRDAVDLAPRDGTRSDATPFDDGFVQRWHGQYPGYVTVAPPRCAPSAGPPDPGRYAWTFDVQVYDGDRLVRTIPFRTGLARGYLWTEATLAWRACHRAFGTTGWYTDVSLTDPLASYPAFHIGRGHTVRVASWLWSDGDRSWVQAGYARDRDTEPTGDVTSPPSGSM